MAKTNDNVELTDLFLMDELYKDKIIYVREIDSVLIYQPEKHYYKVFTNESLEPIIYSFLRGRAKNLTHNMVREIVYHLKMSTNRTIENIDFAYTAFKDKLLNMETFEFENFDDSKIATHYLNYNSEEINMETPVFNKFVTDVMVDEKLRPDIELQTVLQEMFGFYFYNELEPKAVFFLVGSGANGKSIILKTISEIIGQDFINAKSIQTLTTRLFSTSSMAGKKVNICNEEESKYLKGDRFKAIVSGETIEGERKFGDAYDFTPTIKLLFATNNQPSFDGIDHGLRRRLRILPCYRKFSEEEQDKKMWDKIKKEIPGIIKYSIEGAKRLRAQRHIFSKSKSMDKTMIEFENNVSGALMFIRENFEESRENFIAMSMLYQEYKEWCDRNGRKYLSANNFGKDLNVVLEIPSKVQRIPEMVNPQRGRFLKRIILEEDKEEDDL